MVQVQEHLTISKPVLTVVDMAMSECKEEASLVSSNNKKHVPAVMGQVRLLLIHVLTVVAKDITALRRTLRVQGLGERGANGGPNGDLFVEVNVKPHQFFKRDGNDIHLTVPVDFIDAILGTSVDVPTVYGEATLNIPAGTQPGQIFRMRGQGVKDLRSGKPGDQYIHLDIKMPTSLNRKQKDLLTQYRNEIGKDDSLLAKFKKIFKK